MGASVTTTPLQLGSLSGTHSQPYVESLPGAIPLKGARRSVPLKDGSFHVTGGVPAEEDSIPPFVLVEQSARPGRAVRQL